MAPSRRATATRNRRVSLYLACCVFRSLCRGWDGSSLNVQCVSPPSPLVCDVMYKNPLRLASHNDLNTNRKSGVAFPLCIPRLDKCLWVEICAHTVTKKCVKFDVVCTPGGAVKRCQSPSKRKAHLMQYFVGFTQERCRVKPALCPCGSKLLLNYSLVNCII